MRLVLFLNMGGVQRLEDCELFLKNMFNDPYILGIENKFLRTFIAFCITKMRTKAMRKNYAHLGGKSPLNSITNSLCEKLKDRVLGVEFDYVNLYVRPFADEVLSRYDFTKEDEIVLFPLYPHHSKTTVTSSFSVLDEALKRLNIGAKICKMDIFYKNDVYNDLIISHILQTLAHFPAKTLIFSAHSLPLSHIKKGDVYEEQVREHFEFLKLKLQEHFEEILLGYQSKLGPVKWLEPSTASLLAGLKNEALIYPLSFCIDCSETVFELELEYRKIATKDYKVVPCPNDSLEFQNFILSCL